MSRTSELHLCVFADDGVLASSVLDLRNTLGQFVAKWEVAGMRQHLQICGPGLCRKNSKLLPQMKELKYSYSRVIGKWSDGLVVWCAISSDASTVQGKAFNLSIDVHSNSNL